MTSHAQTFWSLLALVGLAAAVFLLVLGRQLVQRQRGGVSQDEIQADAVDPERDDDRP